VSPTGYELKHHPFVDLTSYNEFAPPGSWNVRIYDRPVPVPSIWERDPGADAHEGYEPDKVTGMFRIFADLDGTEEAVLGFAKRFGLLGKEFKSRRFVKEVPGFPPFDDEVRWFPDFNLVDRWRTEIASMRLCLAVLRGDNGGVSIESGPVSGSPWTLRARWGEFESTVRRISESNSWEITHRFSGKPVVSWTSDSWRISTSQNYDLLEDLGETITNAHLSSRTPTLLLHDTDVGHPVCVARPVNLIGFLWLQLAAAIDGDKPYRKCSANGCGNWFELTPKVSRSDKKFCSQACRSRVYRHTFKTRPPKETS
jgi:hypothetical protein